jgi:hypothetical protein
LCRRTLTSWSFLSTALLTTVADRIYATFSFLLSPSSLSPPPPFSSFFHALSVLITASSSLNGILVGAAIARAVQALIRHLIVREHGLSLDGYDALVCWQDRIVHWRWSWTFFVSFSVFIVALLMDSATMAAFGQSVGHENVTYVIPPS